MAKASHETAANGSAEARAARAIDHLHATVPPLIGARTLRERFEHAAAFRSMRSGWWRSIPAIVAVGLVVRMAMFLNYDLPSTHVVGDASEYVMIATLLNKEGLYAVIHPGLFAAPTARRSPLLPVLIAACFRAGGGIGIVFAILAVLGALTCGLIASLAQRYFGDRAGTVAGYAAAIYPGMFITSTTLMTETLFVFLIVALVWSSERISDPGLHSRWGRAAATGAIAGLLALTRAEGIVMALLLVPWLFLNLRRQRFATAAIALLTAALVVAPWVWRNYSVFHAFVPGSSVSGWVFAGANNEQVYFESRCVGGWAGDFRKLPEYRECARISVQDEVRYSSCLTRQAGAYAWAHRYQWPIVVSWRLRRALDLWDPHISSFLERIEGRPPTLTLLAAWAFYPVMLLALLGAARFLLSMRTLLWLYAIPCFYLAQIGATWGVQRLRAPMEPFLLLLAVGFVAQALGAASPKGDALPAAITEDTRAT